VRGPVLPDGRALLAGRGGRVPRAGTAEPGDVGAVPAAGGVPDDPRRGRRWRARGTGAGPPANGSAPASAAGPRAATGVKGTRMAVVNALTFDVEDYFHVTGFADHIDPATWDLYELRIELGSRTILDALAAAGCRATFFVLGWVARRCPALVRVIADA